MTTVICADRIDPHNVPEHTVSIDGLCHRPTMPADSSTGLVVGLCSEDADLPSLHQEARAHGVDPLGIEVVMMHPSDRGDRDRLQVRLAAAQRRAAAFEGSGPEHVKVTVPEMISRRSLLRMRLPVYRSAPHPNRSTCAVVDGCRVCVDVCPHAALSVAGGIVVHDRVACETCGRCVADCPTGAMVNPTTTPSLIRAEVAGLSAAGARAVVFGCGRVPSRPTPQGWYPVAVPCVGMLRAHWLLAPLFMGMSAVAVETCGCGVEDDADSRVQLTLGFARKWLASFEGAPELRLQSTAGLIPTDPYEPAELGAPFESLGAAEIALEIAARSDNGSTASGWAAPLGRVEIEEGLCTGCQRCIQACPTAALAGVRSEDALSIAFQAGRCVACGTCVQLCPEPGAMTVRRSVDPVKVAAGPVTLVTHEMVACRSCGGDIGPAATLEHIANRLGNHPAVKQVTSLCLDCRGTRTLY